MRLMRAGLSPTKISHIFISHLHGDHIFGLPGYLTSQQMLSRQKPLTIVGPEGLRKLLITIQEVSGYQLDYSLNIIEISSDDWEFATDSFQVVAQQLDHRTTCYGFRFTEPAKPGRFNSEKAEELGIPHGPDRSRLQQGQSIQLPNGRIVRPEEVLGPPRPGRIITYCTDTRPCAAGIALARNCDVLIHDSTFSDEHSDRASETFHSTARQAAEVAAAAQARLLVLWHISARINEDQEEDILAEARQVFSATILPSDFETLTVQRRG